MCSARASVTWNMETSTSLSQYALCTCISHLYYGNEHVTVTACVIHVHQSPGTWKRTRHCYSMRYTRASVTWNMETYTPLLQYALYTCISHLEHGNVHATVTVCVIHVHQSPGTWKRTRHCYSMRYTRISHLEHGNVHATVTVCVIHASVTWNMETYTPLLQYALYTCISHLEHGNVHATVTVCVIHVHQSPGTWKRTRHCYSMRYTRASVTWNMETYTPLLQYALYTCISHLDCYSMCYTRSLRASVTCTMEKSA